MNGYEWLTYLKDRRPHYATNRIPLIERFANKNFSKSDYVQFGPIYQLFMYAVMLGFHQRERIPLPTASAERKEFVAIDKWFPEAMANYLLVILISQRSIREEIGMDFAAMDTLKEGEIKDIFKRLIKIMEEYANGGLGIINDRFETDPQFFSNPFAFPILLKEIVDGKINQQD